MRGRLSNKGMKLTRVGAGAERTGRSGARCWSAAQLMPGVRRLIRVPTDHGGQA